MADAKTDALIRKIALAGIALVAVTELAAEGALNRDEHVLARFEELQEACVAFAKCARKKHQKRLRGKH